MVKSLVRRNRIKLAFGALIRRRGKAQPRTAFGYFLEGNNTGGSVYPILPEMIFLILRTLFIKNGVARLRALRFSVRRKRTVAKRSNRM